jgi:hypothetical protein
LDNGFGPEAVPPRPLCAKSGAAERDLRSDHREWRFLAGYLAARTVINTIRSTTMKAMKRQTMDATAT